MEIWVTVISDLFLLSFMIGIQFKIMGGYLEKKVTLPLYILFSIVQITALIFYFLIRR